MTKTTRPRGKKRPVLLGFIAVLLGLYIAPVTYRVAAYHFDWNPAVAWAASVPGIKQLAPDPGSTSDAIIQVYAARALHWRGALGVHTWIATKKSGEDYFTRLEVMGYALRWSGQTVQMRRGQPDRYWYGNAPQLLRDLRGGEDVDKMIDTIHSAAAAYRFNEQYNVWPGPNSNTFIAHLSRQVPALSLDLPPTAIGKDYLVNTNIIGKPPSGKGIQISVKGFFGLILSPEEGLEINLLGFNAGLDLSPPAIKLPAVGRLGFESSNTL